MLEVLDNFTKTPNVIFVIMKFISGSEYKIVLHIVRQTLGYEKSSDGISISQFVEVTGLSKAQVNNTIKSLKEKKIIRVSGQTHKNGGKSYNRYSLNFKTIDTLGQKVSKGGSESVHTKDNRQNTIIQKKREI